MRQLLARAVGLALLGSMCNCSPVWQKSGEPPFVGPGPDVEPFPEPQSPTVAFGPALSLQQLTAPISGGTLLALPDGLTAVAADPDHDKIWVVDLTAQLVKRQITLQSGDEPGRLVLDGKGRVHVALRRGGALLSFDPNATASADAPERRAVCPAPRGLAYDASNDAIHVACAGGELVSLPAAGGVAIRTLQLDSDLRDVIVRGADLLVTRFRSAELLTLDQSGAITNRTSPGNFSSVQVRGGVWFEPAVAWRTIAAANGGVLMVHQRGTTESVQTHGSVTGGPPTTSPGGNSPYGGGSSGQVPDCTSIVHSAVTMIAPNGRGRLTFPQVLPVDIAESSDGEFIGVASAGMSHSLFTGSASSFRIFSRAELSNPDFCSTGSSNVDLGSKQPVAVAATQATWIIQTRNPTGIFDISTGNFTILANDGPEDSGHAIFHSTSGNSIACASCHPEGGDDGRTWNFDFGARRTQSLRAGILATKPFHWAGDEADLGALVFDVFVQRMGGPNLGPSYTDVLGKWLDRIPRIAPSLPADATQLARGEALFKDSALGCTSCHNGPKLTNNTSLDVGTGGVFQVPSLVGVGARGPWMHSGCARQLSDRFTDPSCSGGDLHGHTSQLSSSQIADLVGYLQSL